MDKNVIQMLIKKAVKNSEDAMANYSIALESYSSIALAAINALTLSDETCELYEQLDANRWMALIAYRIL